MNNILKYRIIALSLVVVFAVFNIGIPIIIASCPMAAMMQSGKCAMCDDQDDPATSKVTTEVNTSCCATTILAERNTNEFVQAKVSISDLSKLLSVVLTANVYQVLVLQSPVSVVYHVSSSPPIVVDIPIFVSSLLI